MKRQAGIDYARITDLTVQEVRCCALFAHLTDEEADEVIETLKIFTKIAYDLYTNERKNFENTNQNRIL